MPGAPSRPAAATLSGGACWLMPWPRLKTWPLRAPSCSTPPKLSSACSTSRRTASGPAKSTAGSRLPCSAMPGPTPSTRVAEMHGPVEADDVGSRRRDLLEPGSAALGEDDVRHAPPPDSRVNDAEHLSRVGEAEGLERAVGEHAAPAVEHHHRLRAGVDLRIEVGGDRFGIDREDPVQQVGPVVQHRLDEAVVVRAAALDHVAGERPRAAGEADQRHAAVERAADLCDGIEDVAQLRQVGDGEAGDRAFVAQRCREARPLALRRTTGRGPLRRER